MLSRIVFLGFWKPVLHEVNDAQNYLQTEGLNVHYFTNAFYRKNERIGRCAKNVFEDFGILMELQ